LVVERFTAARPQGRAQQRT